MIELRFASQWACCTVHSTAGQLDDKRRQQETPPLSEAITSRRLTSKLMTPVWG